MPQHRRKPLSRLLAATALAALGLPALAAQVSVQQQTNFTRLNFAFDQPVKLSVGGGGQSVILNFDQPVTDKIARLQPQLDAVANGVQQSADGKQIVLNLKKNYRIRQFVSGSTVGIDIMGSAVDTPAPKPAAPVTPPAPPPPPPAAVTPPAPAPAEVPKAIVPPAPAKANPVMTTKQVDPAPVAPKPEPAVIAPPEANAIRTEPASPISTKEEAAATPDVMTTKQPEPAIAAPPAEAFVPDESVAPVEALGEAEPAVAEKPPEENIAPPAPSVAPVAEVADDEPFMVGVQPVKNGTLLDFPWQERTAAAVFERGNDIWLVFAREADAGAAMLRSVLPKAIIRVEQFGYAGNTVLRLTTDGSLHANAQQPQGDYHWKILLAADKPKATLDIPITTDRDQAGKNYALLGAFDTSPALKFYDPNVGDLLLVIPTYEQGRGVSNLRTTPEFELMATQQGIAIASLRDDLTTQKLRSGIKLYGREALAVSSVLPTIAPNATPVQGTSAAADVMIPYDRWFIAADSFAEARMERLAALSTANTEGRADALMNMVQLYMGQGMAGEALGYLDLIREKYPDYYTTKKLALLNAASNFMLNRMNDAAKAIDAPELEGMEEAELWRQAIGLYAAPRSEVELLQEGVNEQASAESEAARAAAEAEAKEVQKAVDAAGIDAKAAPAPSEETPAAEASDAAAATEAVEEEEEEEEAEETAEDAAMQPLETPAEPEHPKGFDYLAFNKKYIRFYPPRMRQKLAISAADYYAAHGEGDKAVQVYDSLNSDGLLVPIQPYAELMLGEIALKKNKNKDALRVFDRLGKESPDRYVQARARYNAIMLRFQDKTATAKETAKALEQLRMSWRGDGLEREMLFNLGKIYQQDKQYDMTLRSWKELLTTFPGDSATLSIAGDMTELFENLFLHGMADDMPPLKSLALFYEFRDLTPIGTRGDEIIQKLADRLAAVDLLDRATQLLEHQIRFRVSGEVRAKVGARLGLLYLLNKQPKRALEVMQITNYGDVPADLRRTRLQIMAQALEQVGRPEEALSLLFNDVSVDGAMLRLDILWGMQDWPNVINQAEDILADREDMTAPLNAREANVLLKLALAYSFERDGTQLKFLRDYYMGMLGNTPYKDTFDYITNDTMPLDTDDFELVAQQISRTESFLGNFRKQIEAGDLSKAVP